MMKDLTYSWLKNTVTTFVVCAFEKNQQKYIHQNKYSTLTLNELMFNTIYKCETLLFEIKNEIIEEELHNTIRIYNSFCAVLEKEKCPKVIVQLPNDQLNPNYIKKSTIYFYMQHFWVIEYTRYELIPRLLLLNVAGFGHQYNTTDTYTEHYYLHVYKKYIQTIYQFLYDFMTLIRNELAQHPRRLISQEL